MSSTPRHEFSPFAVAQDLVDQYASQELTSEEYLQAIERYVQHVSGWGRHLSGLELPSGEDAEESRVLLQAALEGVERVLEGAETLAALAEERTEADSEQIAEQGLQLVLEGQRLMQQVQEISDQNITSAIDDARYMD